MHFPSHLWGKYRTPSFLRGDTNIQQEPYGVSVQCFCFHQEKGVFHQIWYPSDHK